MLILFNPVNLFQVSIIEKLLAHGHINPLKMAVVKQNSGNSLSAHVQGNWGGGEIEHHLTKHQKAIKRNEVDIDM